MWIRFRQTETSAQEDSIADHKQGAGPSERSDAGTLLTRRKHDDRSTQACLFHPLRSMLEVGSLRAWACVFVACGAVFPC